MANTQGGKHIRGLTVLDAGSILLGRALRTEEISDLSTLGWLVEILNGALCMWDAIMDGSSTRRSQPCWYRREGVGLMAINDAYYVESTIFHILKFNFHHHPAYVDLLELYIEAGRRVKLGQTADMLATNRHLTLRDFTVANYESIVKNKTAYYSTYLPLAVALLYTQLATPKNLAETYKVSMLLGICFQVQDAFLDVYGDSRLTGKVGTDIQENKCTWLIAEVLQRCNSDQRSVLDISYGRPEEEHVANVRAVFKQLDMPQVYQNWMRTYIDSIKSTISLADESEGLKRKIFTFMLSKLLADDRKQFPQGC